MLACLIAFWHVLKRDADSTRFVHHLIMPQKAIAGALPLLIVIVWLAIGFEGDDSADLWKAAPDSHGEAFKILGFRTGAPAGDGSAGRDGSIIRCLGRNSASASLRAVLIFW